MLLILARFCWTGYLLWASVHVFKHAILRQKIKLPFTNAKIYKVSKVSYYLVECSSLVSYKILFIYYQLTQKNYNTKYDCLVWYFVRCFSLNKGCGFLKLFILLILDSNKIRPIFISLIVQAILLSLFKFNITKIKSSNLL